MSDAGSDENRSVLSSSALMASGTIVSRLSGYVRTMLLAWALGNLLHADVFNLANTVPNMLYILLAGGIFNAVLVPQLVRTMKNDPDGGDAYANRIVTLAALFLGAVTVLLVVAAPLIMQIFMPAAYADPALAAQRDSVIAFARLCLPQVFFYGMFVLAGQILNARGRFGPMMWAPIANNVIAVGVLVIYLVTFGAATEAEQCGGFTTGQELLLGLGSTAGIVVQFLILVPYLRATGFRFHPRLDFRGTGLGHTLRLGAWTVGFVIVNQIAYTVVVRLASSGTAQAQLGGNCVDRGASLADQGTGLTIYANSFLMMMVPHAIVTVSLATAVLPRLAARAADTDLAGMARTLAETLRTALAVVLPFAALLPIIALDLANALFGLGAGRDSFALYQPVLALFGPGLVLFTVHYLMLRGFYALERNKTVFLIQCGVATVNVAVAIALVTRTDPRATAPSLVIAYVCAYAVGSVASYTVLRRTLGGLRTPTLVRFVVRMLLAVAAGTAVAVLVSRLLHAISGDRPSPPVAVVLVVLVTAADAAVFLAVARLLRITEVTAVVETITAPLTRRRRGAWRP